ncbi:MAG: YtxH domain-containing protein [Paenibacillus sp.]|nr:YtxH domain-containing protein [Paenibacillus sp.]
MNNNKKNALWGVVVGSIVGSVTALLLAPKAGKELRKDIADSATTTLEKAQEIAAQASDKSVELYDKAKDVVVEVREWGKQRLGSEADETAEVSGITTDEVAGDVDVDAVVNATDSIDAVDADAVVDVDSIIADAGLEDTDKNKNE